MGVNKYSASVIAPVMYQVRSSFQFLHCFGVGMLEIGFAGTFHTPEAWWLTFITVRTRYTRTAVAHCTTSETNPISIGRYVEGNVAFNAPAISRGVCTILYCSVVLMSH